ncbi:hypothetical protein HOY34_18460 [Xinfangfangia sp. D13-10-4-6]|uniref:hypothetical protein n=1 Tax=Pseudogemmobacter hezensis TaxID=2737662 RepID=UPI001554A218|nr:hypothetical protein [Pseudogemmobacter hezensis]NPD17177.1 hypothetical protein [Pseudogemmobacter hezensis]
MRGAALAAAIGTALLAGPVRAEVIELFPSECDASPPLEDLVGPYRLSVFPGTLTDGVRSVAASHHSSHAVSLILMGEDLVLQDASGGPAVSFRYVGPDEPGWRGDDGEVSTEELAEIAGCDVNRLPRLIGSGTTMADGGQVSFTYRLMVWNMTPDHAALIGGMEWSGGGVTVTRRVMMEAQ